MFLGKTKISKKDDSAKPGKVFELFAQEIQAFPKQAKEAFGDSFHTANEGMGVFGLNG